MISKTEHTSLSTQRFSVTVLFSLSFIYIPCVESAANKLELISTLKVPLNDCSAESTFVDWRSLGMTNGYGCPPEEPYLCGEDSKGTYRIEKCQPILQCEPGFTPTFIVDFKKEAVLVCRPCPEGRFEPDFTNSSRSSLLLGCSYKHMLPEDISPNLVRFREGTKSTKAIYYCDIKHGFYEENRNMFCDDVQTYPCHCIKRSCTKGRLLKTDGECVECSTYLDPNDQFRCAPEDRPSPEAPMSIQNHSNDAKKEQPAPITDGPVNISSSTDGTEGNSSHGWKNGAVIAIAVSVVVVVVFFLAVVFLIALRPDLWKALCQMVRRGVCNRAEQNQPENRVNGLALEGVNPRAVINGDVSPQPTPPTAIVYPTPQQTQLNDQRMAYLAVHSREWDPLMSGQNDATDETVPKQTREI